MATKEDSNLRKRIVKQKCENKEETKKFKSKKKQNK